MNIQTKSILCLFLVLLNSGEAFTTTMPISSGICAKSASEAAAAHRNNSADFLLGLNEAYALLLSLLPVEDRLVVEKADPSVLVAVVPEFDSDLEKSAGERGAPYRDDVRALALRIRHRRWLIAQTLQAGRTVTQCWTQAEMHGFSRRVKRRMKRELSRFGLKEFCATSAVGGVMTSLTLVGGLSLFVAAISNDLAAAASVFATRPVVEFAGQIGAFGFVLGPIVARATMNFDIRTKINAHEWVETLRAVQDMKKDEKSLLQFREFQSDENWVEVILLKTPGQNPRLLLMTPELNSEPS